MERKVLAGEVIAEFFETTLEMRRFEKNYFLYSEESDFKENSHYRAKALKLLSENIEGLQDVTYSHLMATLRDHLGNYGELMDLYKQYHAGRIGRTSGIGGTAGTGRIGSTGRTGISAAGSISTGSAAASRAVEASQDRIRELGKSITTDAEKISTTEKEVLRKFLKRSRRFIVLSILALTLLSLVTGHVLSKMVAKPLKQLQESMNLISEGGFKMIVIDSRDREISSLMNAFNKMLREMELRRRHLIQTEKLVSLGTLLSGVAHELNNPLSNISSSCQILIEEMADADMSYKMELLSNIDTQTVRARNIVRSILEFSRDGNLQKERLPLKKLFEETIRFIRVQFPDGVSIHIDIAESIEIFANKQRIQQVFLNLLKNAAEAVADEGSISVKSTRQSDVELCLKGVAICVKHGGGCSFNGCAVDIIISDTGMGIPQDVLPHIFDPFFTTKDVGKGSGLGLFIVHEIIEEHNGCIAISSELGKGTTFLIRLPDENFAGTDVEA
ncbi:MAG: HAMP domain-containing histidine kinase [Nitrospirae bacterium]|nr:HAMP domain-containing histidine kinase [Nitrospirota bacterium]